MNAKSDLSVASSFGIQKGDMLVVTDGTTTQTVLVEDVKNTTLIVGKASWWRRFWQWLRRLWPF